MHGGPLLISGAVGFLVAYLSGSTNAVDMGGPSLLATTFVLCTLPVLSGLYAHGNRLEKLPVEIGMLAVGLGDF